MTIEEILKLISLYHKAIVKATESRLIVEAAEKLYGENIDLVKVADYNLLIELRTAQENLIKAIKQYNVQEISGHQDKVTIKELADNLSSLLHWVIPKEFFMPPINEVKLCFEKERINFMRKLEYLVSLQDK